MILFKNIVKIKSWKNEIEKDKDIQNINLDFYLTDES